MDCGFFDCLKWERTYVNNLHNATFAESYMRRIYAHEKLTYAEICDFFVRTFGCVRICEEIVSAKKKIHIVFENVCICDRLLATYAIEYMSHMRPFRICKCFSPI